MNLLEYLLELINDFNERHPIIFEIIVTLLELFVGIALALWIMNLIGII